MHLCYPMTWSTSYDVPHTFTCMELCWIWVQRDDITTYFNVDAFTNFKVLAKDEIIYDAQQIQIIFVHEGLAAAFGSIINQKDLDFDAGASVFWTGHGQGNIWFITKV